MCRTRALAALVAVALSAHASGGEIISTFEVDDEGWGANNVIINHQASGGNPGGFLEVTDLAFESFIRAPSKFLGNRSTSNGGSISFDVIKISGTGDPGGGTGNVTLRSGSDFAVLKLIESIPGTWTNASAPLTAAAWGKSQSAWDALLANLTAIEIVVDPTNSAGDVSGFDNFRMTVIPEPSMFVCAVVCLLTCLPRTRPS